MRLNIGNEMLVISMKREKAPNYPTVDALTSAFPLSRSSSVSTSDSGAPGTIQNTTEEPAVTRYPEENDVIDLPLQHEACLITA